MVQQMNGIKRSIRATLVKTVLSIGHGFSHPR